MNKHYTQIAEFVLPYHAGEEHVTTVYVFDVTDEKAEKLEEILDMHGYSAWTVERCIKEDLGAYDDYNVMPGAPFHRYSVRFDYPHTVYLEDTLAYNV